MFVNSVSKIKGTDREVEWGNGLSYRLLVAEDAMGFTVCHTIVRAGTESLLEYRNHLEACYCIAGEGEVEDMSGQRFPITVGDIYVLDRHDKHYLRGGRTEDLILVSVFNPALKGTERHSLSGDGGSSY